MIHFPVEKIKGALVSDLGGLIAIESIKGGAGPKAVWPRAGRGASWIYAGKG